MIIAHRVACSDFCEFWTYSGVRVAPRLRIYIPYLGGLIAGSSRRQVAYNGNIEF